MKITEDDNSVNDVDIFKIINDLQQRYRNVHAFSIKGQVYVYRALGRKEYKDIMMDTTINDFEKEEEICKTCILYPEDIDWRKLPAGIPTELTKKIRKDSYLDNTESWKHLLEFYRREMYNLDNQITCIVSEATGIDFEKVEQWDMEKTLKYLSRAEWVLQNLRGLQFLADIGEFSNEENKYEEPVQEAQRPEPSIQAPVKERRNPEKNLRGGDKRDKVTPAKIRDSKPASPPGAMSLEELRRKFPEVNWGTEDKGLQGMDGMRFAPTADVNPALSTNETEAPAWRAERLKREKAEREAKEKS